MDKVLWKKIKALEFDQAGIDLPFTRRLARENRWTAAHAQRVVDEYRRFIYLVAATRNEQTPSDAVDQAWHLHLSYTQSYWGDLCKDILGFDLHHCPTRGGRSEQRRFKDQYMRTLKDYQDAFDERPTVDIWPPVEKRFEFAGEFVRVNTGDSWVVRKPRFLRAEYVVVLLMPLLLVSCSADLSDKGLMFWLKVVAGVVVVYYIIKYLRWLGWQGGRGGCSTTCGGCGGD